jgi:hypothetical protein
MCQPCIGDALNLGRELGGANINRNFAELIAPTRKRDLYLITFHPCRVRVFTGCIEDALSGQLTPTHKRSPTQFFQPN